MMKKKFRCNKILFLCYIFILTILLTGGNFTEAKQGQPLWGETISGMTPEEVLNVVDEAHKIKNGNGVHYSNGSKELVRIDNYELVGKSFEVRFIFLNNKLTQVELVLEEEKNFSSSKLIFDELANVLRSKYGKEISKKTDTQSKLNIKQVEAVWMNNQTNIRLYLDSYPGLPTLLKVIYQTMLYEEAGKL